MVGRRRSKADPAVEAAFEHALTAISSDDGVGLSRMLSANHLLATARDPEGRTLLLNACMPIMRRASVEVVRVLIAAGSDVRAADYADLTALHGIVLMDTESVVQPVREVANLLVGAGLPVDSTDRYGNTPLWRAVFVSAHKRIFDGIDALLELGADPTRKNNSAVSPQDLVRRIDGADALRVHLSTHWTRWSWA